MKKEKNTVSYTLKQAKATSGKTNWKTFDAQLEEKLDASELPALNQAFWQNLNMLTPVKKTAAGIRLDDDILAWFKKQIGKGYQSQINAILRAYMFAQATAKNAH